MSARVFAVDLGATWLRTALVSPADEAIEARSAVPTPETAAEACALLDAAWRCAGAPRTVALATAPELAPGGVVRRWPNRRSYEGHRLLSDALAACAPALFDDATAAAISGHPRGDQRSSTVCVTVGTGVGGGAVVAGVPLLGRSGAAMDVGHMPVPAAAGLSCRCGRVGCVQAAASGRALRRYLAGAETDIFRQHDSDAAAAIARAAVALAETLAIIDRLFNSTRVIVAGGLGLSRLYGRIEGALKDRQIAIPLARHPAGEDAGLLGAAIGFDLRRRGSGS
ncbi:MAG: ROK family protein [Pseudolabrys sp.]